MQRELDSLPLPPTQRKKLQAKGFLLVEDVIHLKPSQLSHELEVSMEEALDVLKLVKSETNVNSGSKSRKACTTALEMLRDGQSQQQIVTFSQSLDDILGGGVPLTKITEFCGAPGVGKTQMSMQLCVDVQIPECFGGLAGEAVYIDTEGSFIVDRVVDIAKATVDHCQQITSCEKLQEQFDTMGTFTFKTVLSGIHYFRCHNYVQLIALVHTIPDFLKQRPKVKLIVVDSIAFHFRHDFDDYALRTRLLNGMAQSFVKMATLNKLAVVLTNQMTTKFERDKSASHLIPALGESWGHASTLRVILYWENSQRYARLYKSPSRQEAVVPYQVTTGGIRDTPKPSTSEDNDQHDHSQPSKRQRTS